MAVTIEEEILIEFNSNIQELTRELKSAQRETEKATSSMRDDFNDLGKAIGVVTAAVTAMSGALVWVAKDIVDTAAQFEDFSTVLRTVEGSSLAAQESMDWIVDFAVKTPYELDKVTEAYVRLRTYGINPTDGALKTLGDTAAAMNKPIMQAVEAFADALTGEFERLKEFGIKARREGELITFQYTDQYGKMKEAVVENNRQIIDSTLSAIWNEKYGGAMDELSKTWNGMMSNMSDAYIKFQKGIAETGLFDELKKSLKDSLDLVTEISESAENMVLIAKALAGALAVVASIASGISTVIEGWRYLIETVQFVWENFGKQLKALMLSWKIAWDELMLELSDSYNKMASKLSLPEIDQTGLITSLNLAIDKQAQLNKEIGKAREEWSASVFDIQKQHQLIDDLLEPLKNVNVEYDKARKSIVAMSDATTNLKDDTDELSEAQKKAAKEYLELLKEIEDALGSKLENAFMDSINQMMDGAMDWRDFMIEMIKDVIAEMLRLLIVKDAASAISGGITGLFSAPAVASKSTGMAKIASTSSGETAGAYVPNLDYGTQSSEVNVNVLNYGNDQVTVEQNGNDIDIVINALSEQVARGTGPFPDSLESRYGLSKV